MWGGRYHDALQRCLEMNDSSTRIVCMSKYLERLAFTQGADEAMKTLAMVDTKVGGTTCHILAHAIGYGLYRRAGEQYPQAIARYEEEGGCSFGIAHGLIERDLLTGRWDGRSFPDICKNQEAWCVHAVGHAVLLSSRGLLDAALEICDRAGSNEVNFYCYEGVFMEYHTAFGLVSHQLVPESWLDGTGRLDELVAVCNAASGTTHAACWEEIVHVVLGSTSNTLSDVFNLCDDASDEDGKLMCKLHATGVLMQETDMVRHGFDVCDFSDMTDDAFRSDCIRMVVVARLFDYPDSLSSVIDSCTGFDYIIARACLETVGRMARRQQHLSERAHLVCLDVPADLRDLCRGTDSEPYVFPWESV